MEPIRESVTQTKRDIRKHILTLRDSILPEDRACWDTGIRNRVLAHSAYLEAKVILAYASYRSETDTMGLIRQALTDGKYVFAPKVSGDEMEFWQIRRPEDLQSGYRGIPEPVQDISLPEWAERASKCDGANNEKRVCKAMMWMPGAAFDANRHRIGYGRGFYDRYLGRTSDTNKDISFHDVGFRLQLVKAALAYGCQIVQQIPYEPHDVRPDMIITEKEIL